MPGLKIGGADHKDRFCRSFADTFVPYEPHEIPWPELDADALTRLRALPFWGEAVSSERTAAARVRKMADVETDPKLREAIALQAYEEERHARLLDMLLAHYEIPVPADGPEVPRDAEWGFLRMGYGELFDSFFAFGLFKFASESGLFPKPLVKVFDGVMQEEARHILFFQNWSAYRRVNLPVGQRPWFMLRRSMGLALQALGRVKTALQLRDTGESDDFTMQVPEEIGEVSLPKLAALCMAENERRLAEYDPELLRPTTVPRLVRVAMRFMPGATATETH